MTASKPFRFDLAVYLTDRTTKKRERKKKRETKKKKKKKKVKKKRRRSWKCVNELVRMGKERERERKR